MELESIPKFLEKKTILVTGATGFLAKAFVEKILRVQPDVKRLYLLIRASGLASATQRLHNDITGKDLFMDVQEMWGYDVALGINTYGALHVLGFAKNCINLKVLLHVSTAYVCGEKKGQILESPFHMEQTLNGSSGLDINAKKQLVEEYLNNLWGQGATDGAITSTMKDLGNKRLL